MTDRTPVYEFLRDLMLGAAGELVVARDEPGYLEVRTNTVDAKTGEPTWFGMVTIKKSYVSYHLIGLYEAPLLTETLSPALQKRRQGKTCFNFTTVDHDLGEELAALTTRLREAAA